MKWFLRGLTTFILLLIIGGGGGYIWLRGSLPQVDGSISLPGLEGAATIVRDRHGIPHITAQTGAMLPFPWALPMPRIDYGRWR